jgi:hypothetical protein
MMGMKQRAHGVDDELVNLALTGLLAATGLAVLLRVAGTLAAGLLAPSDPGVV